MSILTQNDDSWANLRSHLFQMASSGDIDPKSSCYLQILLFIKISGKAFLFLFLHKHFAKWWAFIKFVFEP